MQTDGTPLSSNDFERIGQLHVKSIDDSLPALLGSTYAAGLYRFLATSEHELLFVELTQERVESCCVVSLDPDSLQARIARATWFALGRYSLVALRRRAFRQYLLGTMRDALRSEARTARAPEITYIFTHRSGRGRGTKRRPTWKIALSAPALGVRRWRSACWASPCWRWGACS